MQKLLISLLALSLVSVVPAYASTTTAPDPESFVVELPPTAEEPELLIIEIPAVPKKAPFTKRHPKVTAVGSVILGVVVLGANVTLSILGLL